MVGADDGIDPWQAQYPVADFTPSELEDWVAEVLGQVGSSEGVMQLDIRTHERVEAHDGTYDIDATVRFRSLGLDFLVLVEVKQHRHPIKRELVQVLHAKTISAGAHKGVMFSTAHFQRGAIDYAKAHGIALVFVTEGRFTIAQRSAGPATALSRDEAARLGVESVVGLCYGVGELSNSTQCVHVGADRPDLVARYVLGVSQTVGRDGGHHKW